jgi:hypothetical protein
MKYELEVIKGVPVINADDKKLLIDTGSPMSLATGGSVGLTGNEFQVHTNLPGVSLESISKSLGSRIDGLIGMDILQDFAITLDYANRYVEFDADEFEGDEVDLKLVMTMPIIEISVNGKNEEVIFDTGADLSYILNTSQYSDFKTDEQYDDFNPAVGDFTTPVYVIPVNFENGEKFDVRFGSLAASSPKEQGQNNAISDMLSMLGGAQGVMSQLQAHKDNPQIKQVLAMMGGIDKVDSALSNVADGSNLLESTIESVGASGVIGYGILQHYSTTLDFRNGKMYIK